MRNVLVVSVVVFGSVAWLLSPSNADAVGRSLDSNVMMQTYGGDGCETNHCTCTATSTCCIGKLGEPNSCTPYVGFGCLNCFNTDREYKCYAGGPAYCVALNEFEDCQDKYSGRCNAPGLKCGDDYQCTAVDPPSIGTCTIKLDTCYWSSEPGGGG